MFVANNSNHDIWDVVMRNKKSYDNASYTKPHSGLMKVRFFWALKEVSRYLEPGFDLTKGSQIGGPSFTRNC